MFVVFQGLHVCLEVCIQKANDPKFVRVNCIRCIVQAVCVYEEELD